MQKKEKKKAIYKNKNHFLLSLLCDLETKKKIIVYIRKVLNQSYKRKNDLPCLRPKRVKERREMVFSFFSYRESWKSSTTFNGKFWNFWPNFIHLKNIFSFFLFSRLLLSSYSICFCFLCAHLYVRMEGR